MFNEFEQKKILFYSDLQNSFSYGILGELQALYTACK